MGKKETNLTKKIFAYIKNKGALIVSYHGDQMSLQGFPDAFGCYKGQFFAIEIKVGRNVPRPNQMEWIERINKWYGGKGLWVNDLNWEEEIDKLFSKMDIEFSTLVLGRMEKHILEEKNYTITYDKEKQEINLKVLGDWENE